MVSLLKFELGTYFKKPGIYIVFILVAAAGFFIGLKLSFNPGAEIYYNAPYCTAIMVGFLSLTGIFTTTFLGAHILFKEQDTGFTLILYATPVTKIHYLFSRLASILGMTFVCFLVLIAGYIAGQLNHPQRILHDTFNLWYYLQPVLTLAAPNLLFCAVTISAVAWLSRSKLMVYLTGLFIYIFYMVLMVYSGSPMMAGALPQSAEAMQLSAKLDPFGLSAFYQQTNLWTVTQKNTSLPDFSGNLMLNRLLYLLFSLALLLIMVVRFKLTIRDDSAGKKEISANEKPVIFLDYKPLPSVTSGLFYHGAVLKSYIRIDILVIIKSMPFVLVAFGLIFFLSMEFYGSIDQGIRLPEQYASTGLIANRIIYNLPGVLQLVVLFYAHELYWRSPDHRFNLIEDSTPTAKITWLLAKWFCLSVIIVLLTTVILVTGITFQWIYQYPKIEWQVYGALYGVVDFPLILCSGVILSLQSIMKNKWVGLLLSCLVMLLLVTSIGKSAGITHPLLRFAAAYPAKYSEMNGWDDYLKSFLWRMIFGMGITVFFVLLGVMATTKIRWKNLAPGLIGAAIFCIVPGIYIAKKTPADKNKELDLRQAYELQFRKYQNLLQPVITDVSTNIDLFPEKNAYQVTGKYILRNSGVNPISKLLVNFDDDLQVAQVCYTAGNINTYSDVKTGLVSLKQPLMPGDTASFNFSFRYNWSGFTGHHSFNAIVKNGTFLRISNYFPSFGYQHDREITSLNERRIRNMGTSTSLRKLEAPHGVSHFINLDMTVSTTAGQTVIGVGDLIGQWRQKDRNYFRYKSGQPIPFRFGISSAEYIVRKVNHRGITFEVYYDKNHYENVNHLIENAKKTMDYCRQNFGPYPYKSIRFAEVSLFTDGFAGTAYPATIFMTEHMLFHDNLKGDKRQDVINELAAHELSHQWWGNGMLAPDEREGSKLLTETLAMYTELMMAMHSIGPLAVKDKLAIHEGIYQNQRGFAKEVPLYKMKPEDTHLSYSKGLLVMDKTCNLIGEQKVNLALRNLLKNHAFPSPPPISTDLINELCSVASPDEKRRIRELFFSK